MSLETAENIYANKYAKKNRYNELESGSDCVILDYGINSGVLRPVWIAQKITGRSRSNVFDDGSGPRHQRLLGRPLRRPHVRRAHDVLARAVDLAAFPRRLVDQGGRPARLLQGHRQRSAGGAGRTTPSPTASPPPRPRSGRTTSCITCSHRSMSMGLRDRRPRGSPGGFSKNTVSRSTASSASTPWLNWQRSRRRHMAA